MSRAEEFVQLFNRVEKSLAQLVNSNKNLPFAQLVDDASKHSAAVKANSGDLKQFAKLRNAIVHDGDFPGQIIAEPSEEALKKFTQIADRVLDPDPLMPTFEARVHCFSLDSKLSEVLIFMRTHDFSQVALRESDGRLSLVTVEGITRWLADNWDGYHSLAGDVRLGRVTVAEPLGSFVIMGPHKSIFDADDAFTNHIHREATRLYAIIITENGGGRDQPIGFVTPWDLVHNPRLPWFTV